MCGVSCGRGILSTTGRRTRCRWGRSGGLRSARFKISQMVTTRCFEGQGFMSPDVHTTASRRGAEQPLPRPGKRKIKRLPPPTRLAAGAQKRHNGLDRRATWLRAGELVDDHGVVVRRLEQQARLGFQRANCGGASLVVARLEDQVTPQKQRLPLASPPSRPWCSGCQHSAVTSSSRNA